MIKYSQIDFLNTMDNPAQALVMKRASLDLRACLEAGFDSEKSQFFDETRRLFEERTVRYGRKKQRSVIKKMTFAAQRLASKQALRNLLWGMIQSEVYFNRQF